MHRQPSKGPHRGHEKTVRTKAEKGTVKQAAQDTVPPREERDIGNHPLPHLEDLSVGAMAQAAEPLEVLLEKGFWPARVIPRTLQGL